MKEQKKRRKEISGKMEMFVSCLGYYLVVYTVNIYWLMCLSSLHFTDQKKSARIIASKSIVR